MREPSRPDLVPRLIEALGEIEAAESLGELSGADVLMRLPTGLLREFATFREEAGEAGDLYEEKGWDEDDVFAPHANLFEHWHNIVDYLYQQGQWADDGLDEEMGA